jgi:hypothetical protein
VGNVAFAGGLLWYVDHNFFPELDHSIDIAVHAVDDCG